MNSHSTVVLYLQTNIDFNPMRMSIWIVVGQDDTNEPLEYMKNATRLIGPVDESRCLDAYDAVKKAVTACGIRYSERSLIDD